jgi:hypothetical protein
LLATVTLPLPHHLPFRCGCIPDPGRTWGTFIHAASSWSIVSGGAGLLHFIWDGLKLGLTEPLLPSQASGVFFWAPVLSFALSQLVWSVSL